MPRPPARRDRINALTRLANEQSNDSGHDDADSTSEATQNPKARKQKTALELYRQTFEDSLQLSNENTLPLVQQYQFSHTPLNKIIRNGLESSPKAPATDSRPATRSRGYSSTLLGGRIGDPSSRITSTPGFENSILSNFKRRQRQPSILQMVQLDASSDLSDFDDENFLGELSPQDESTPMRLASAATNLPKTTMSSPSAVSTHTSIADTSVQRKKSTSKVASVDGLETEVVSPTFRLPSESYTPEPQLPTIENAIEAYSQTLAAPRSSSPCCPGTDLGPGEDEIRDITDTGHTTAPAVKVSTAALQDKLLPRRRARGRKRRSHEGLGDSDSGMSDVDNSDDDELTRMASKKIKRPPRPALIETWPNNKKLVSRARGKAGNDQHNQAMEPSNCNVSGSQQITYGSRHTASLIDKENDLSDGSALSSPPPSVDLDSDFETPEKNHLKPITSEELKVQARKFAEVDQWQLEFEDILTGDSS